MTIKTKLTFLSAGSFLACILIIGIYLALTSPLAIMQAEGEKFKNLTQKCMNLKAEAAFLSTMDIENQSEVFEFAKHDWEKAQADLERITVLTKVNKTLSDAVQTTINLKDLVKEAFLQMDTAIDNMRGTIKELNLKEGQRTIPMLTHAEDVFGMDRANSAQLQLQAKSLYTAINNLNDIFNIQISTLNWQDQIINTELARVRKRSLTIAALAALLILGTMLAISLLIVRSIRNTLSFMDANIRRMSEGDLTEEFDTSRSDEMGELAKRLQSFVETLNLSLGAIQRTARENAQLRERLIESVSETTASTTEIEANSASIRLRMEQLDHLIAEASEKVNGTVRALTEFHTKLSNQNEHIEQSVAAVTETLASISNISRIVELDRKLGSALESESAAGAEVLEESFNKITEVNKSVQAIEEMAELIAGIARQTNLLSMNAAIEAAHAGEAGKGFAVVADEINKLASASASSSANIASTIKQVISKIQEASATKDRTSSAFDAIAKRIKEVTRSIEEIYANINEMQTGSHQILSAMESLKGNSTMITQESSTIKEESEAVQQAFNTANRVSTEVVSNIQEISLGLADISNNVFLVSEHAEAVGQQGMKLEASIEQFKLKSDSEESLPSAVEVEA